MAVDLLLHPIVGLIAIALILATFTAKARDPKFSRLHYAFGLSALAASVAAFALGVYTALRAIAEGVEFEETLVFHLAAAIVLLIVLSAETRSGLRIWRRDLREALLPRHKALARLLVVLLAVVAGLGVITFLTIA